MREDRMFDMLVEYGIATKEEIRLVTAINGYNENVLLDILYVRTGERNFDLYEVEEEEE